MLQKPVCTAQVPEAPPQGLQPLLLELCGPREAWSPTVAQNSPCKGQVAVARAPVLHVRINRLGYMASGLQIRPSVPCPILRGRLSACLRCCCWLRWWLCHAQHGPESRCLAFRGSLPGDDRGAGGPHASAPSWPLHLWHQPVTGSDQMGTTEIGHNRLGNFLICSIFPNDQGGKGAGSLLLGGVPSCRVALTVHTRLLPEGRWLRELVQRAL